MKDLIVKKDLSVREAFQIISKTGEKCLVITKTNGILKGTLSDGDLRKAILRGANLNDSVEKFFNKNPRTLIKNNFNNAEAKKIFLDSKFALIPIIDKNRKVVDIMVWDKIFHSGEQRKSKKLEIPVVIMAGGYGTRLEPFTKVLPKSLVPIHEKPIIEHIIERFNNCGCCDFYLTVNYKARILKAYFDELNFNYDITFIDESEPLGTAGSLKYLTDKFETPFFVTNCDIIIETDYENLHTFHVNEKNDITLVASAKEYIIPYGTCNLTADGHLSHINEKPKYDFLVNTGLYIIEPHILKLIPKDKFFHITHLIEEAKNLGKRVGVYPIDDNSWIDVGQWAEYKKALERIS